MSMLPGSEAVQPLVENLFRRESGKLTASLTRFFGSMHLQLAEDVVQDTLLKAMREWPFRGIPNDPVAWLHRVARNGAIDRLRRDTRGVRVITESRALLESEWTRAATVEEELRSETIADDQLRMMFACCHPNLPPDQQVALALKTLCGFSVQEIADAFVTSEETITKRLYRAREAFRAIGTLEIPAGDALASRLDSVLATIYLLFNEGYKAAQHDDLIREDLIEEALRLCDMLTRNAATARPAAHALLALMLFHTARSSARLDADAAIVLLQDQDRRKWDRELIGLANEHLARAATSDSLTTYHVEAAIAAIHANARTWSETDWPTIVAAYNRLLQLKPTPIVAFNRAIAIAESGDVAGGLEALERIGQLESHHLYHAARGDLLARSGRAEDARAEYTRAMSLAKSPAEIALLGRKLADLAGVTGAIEDQARGGESSEG